MLDNLTERLERVVKALRGEARLTEDNIQATLREVRLALLEADVALPVVRQFIAAVRDKAVGQDVLTSLTPGQALIGVVQRELTALMGGGAIPLDLATTPPAVILLAGLQGAGKTTTAAKLARLLRDDSRKNVLLASCDVYRPAAMEQLATLARQLGIACFAAAPGAEPVQIARDALDWARKHYHDVLIVDTAGRLAIDAAMMRRDCRAACGVASDRNVVRRRCDARAGCGQHGQGLRRDFAAYRRGADQARRRRARRGGAVGASGDRCPDQVRRRCRKARRTRGLPSRAHGGAHSRHG